MYGFLHPETGESYWLLLPSVNVEVFTIALQQFAQAISAGPERQIVLVLDRAGWHSSQVLAVPDGVHLVFLPPYSPELQPAERLWPLCNEVLANRRFETLDELQGVQAQRCVALQDNPAQTRAHILFHFLFQEIRHTRDKLHLARFG
jgi:transposase